MMGIKLDRLILCYLKMKFPNDDNYYYFNALEPNTWKRKLKYSDLERFSQLDLISYHRQDGVNLLDEINSSDNFDAEVFEMIDYINSLVRITASFSSSHRRFHVILAMSLAKIRLLFYSNKFNAGNKRQYLLYFSQSLLRQFFSQFFFAKIKKHEFLMILNRIRSG